jgi:uncharacterized repeat protein (TIGR03847 family)
MLPAGVGYTTVELKVSFLRPITLKTGRLLCEGTIIHLGSRIATAEESDEIEADEVIVVKLTPSYARDFVARAQALVAAGRPSCPFCLQPMDPHGHICPRANGYRRPLFD